MSAHVCDSGHFDRTLCPEPCGTMHSFCSICGARADACAHEPDAAPTQADAIAESLWKAIDDDAIEGRLTRTDCDFVVGFVLGHLRGTQAREETSAQC